MKATNVRSRSIHTLRRVVRVAVLVLYAGVAHGGAGDPQEAPVCPSPADARALGAGAAGGDELEALRLEVVELRRQLADLNARVTLLDTGVDALNAKTACMSASEHDTYFTGCNVHVRDGSGDTDGPTNGLGNLIVGYNESYTPGASRNGSHNLVVGPEHAYSSFGGLVAGFYNAVTAPHASVTGGAFNVASMNRASVSGGERNRAGGLSSTVSGGVDNTAGGEFAAVSGGFDNAATDKYAAVSGGSMNSASGVAASVTGGSGNEASGMYAAVSGGELNRAGATNASVAGGIYNRADGSHSQIAGGRQNQTGEQYVAISGEARAVLASSSAGAPTQVREESATEREPETDTEDAPVADARRWSWNAEAWAEASPRGEPTRWREHPHEVSPFKLRDRDFNPSAGSPLTTR